MMKTATNKMLDFGLVYCSTGRDYDRATILSLLTFPPEIPALILCEDDAIFKVALDRCDRDNVMVLTPKIPDQYTGYQRSRYLKMVAAPILSPFRYSLGIDSDTLCTDRFQIPHLLEYYDVGMVFDRMPHGPRMGEIEKIFTSYLLPPNHFEHFEFNGGVVLWRRGSGAAEFWEACFEEYMRFGDFEQPAIMRAVYGYGIPIQPLPISLNYPAYLFCAQSAAVHRPQIVHCLGGQVKSGEFYRTSAAIAPDALARFHALELPLEITETIHANRDR